MNEQTNLTKAREALDAFSRGDVDAAFVHWAPNGVWHVLNGQSAADYSQDAYRQMLATSWVQQYVEPPRVDVLGIKGVGDEFVVTEIRLLRAQNCRSRTLGDATT